MYSIKLASEIPGINPICKIGYPDNVYADLCIVSEMVPVHNIPMNSIVLRKALLDSAELLEEALDLKIVDVKDIKQAKPKKKAKVAAKPKPKPKPKPKAEEAPKPAPKQVKAEDIEDDDEWKS